MTPNVIRYNYEKDFTIEVELPEIVGSSDFRIDLFTKGVETYSALRRLGKYTSNIRPTSTANKYIVVLRKHQLPVGKVKVRVYYWVKNAQSPDGIMQEVLPTQDTGIELWEGGTERANRIRIALEQGSDANTSISEIATTYQLSDSGTKVPTGSWSTTPFTRKGKYLWSRMAIQLSTGAVRYHYTVAYQGEDATGDVPTPNFIMQMDSSESVIFATVFIDMSAESYIVYVKDIQAFAHRKSGTNELYVNFTTKDAVTADYQTVEGTTATIHTNKTFVKKNTNQLYVFNATDGLTQINSIIIIQ